MEPTLHTDRLILRPPSLEDFDAWAAFMADPVATRFIGGVQERAFAWRGLAMVAGAWVLHGFSMFSVVERSSGRWVGRLGSWQPEGWPGPEIAWGLARSDWGKGYAQEGTAAAIDWAFNELGWTEVIHCIDPANTASRALATRLGSYQRGHGRLPPPFENHLLEIWGQTKEEWRRHG